MSTRDPSPFQAPAKVRKRVGDGPRRRKTQRSLDPLQRDPKASIAAILEAWNHHASKGIRPSYTFPGGSTSDIEQRRAALRRAFTTSSTARPDHEWPPGDEPHAPDDPNVTDQTLSEVCLPRREPGSASQTQAVTAENEALAAGEFDTAFTADALIALEWLSAAIKADKRRRSDPTTLRTGADPTQTTSRGSHSSLIPTPYDMHRYLGLSEESQDWLRGLLTARLWGRGPARSDAVAAESAPLVKHDELEEHSDPETSGSKVRPESGNPVAVNSIIDELEHILGEALSMAKRHAVPQPSDSTQSRRTVTSTYSSQDDDPLPDDQALTPVNANAEDLDPPRLRRSSTFDYHRMLTGMNQDEKAVARRLSTIADEVCSSTAADSSIIQFDFSRPSEPDFDAENRPVSLVESRKAHDKQWASSPNVDTYELSSQLERQPSFDARSSLTVSTYPAAGTEDTTSRFSFRPGPEVLTIPLSHHNGETSELPRHFSIRVRMPSNRSHHPHLVEHESSRSMTPSVHNVVEEETLPPQPSPIDSDGKKPSVVPWRKTGLEYPEIHPRSSSMNLLFRPQSRGALTHLSGVSPKSQTPVAAFKRHRAGKSNLHRSPLMHGDDGAPYTYDPQRGFGPGPLPEGDPEPGRNSFEAEPPPTEEERHRHRGLRMRRFSLRNRRHYSLEEHRPFNLHRAHRRSPIARDWSAPRKRFTAAVACLSTALMGLIIGIYAGEVPAIQYAIVDENHYAILGNVVFYLGLALPTAFLYPLPVLHGRKPYTLGALILLMPLQFPPALIVSQQRTPDDPIYRTGLLLSRALAGFVMGFANINFFTTLLDLFGASLMSSNPHQESVIEHDPRRHGGGMGLWLGIWTWCFIGSLGLGFFIGAMIISGLNVAWGFWIIIFLVVIALILNVITPEVRRSAYRRSMAEVPNDKSPSGVSRRVAKGEIMMHLYATGPLHWWEEVRAGWVLSARMLRQPGFLIMSVYLGWMYAQIVIVIILLGALTSQYYMFEPQTVATCALAVPLGALLAVPFQKASLFSRSRSRPPRTDSMTFEKRVTWTSHLIRRAMFMLALPLAGIAYTLASGGPSEVHAAAPSVFAGAIAFFSCLALSECIGIVMETFDTSDLQAGMTGRRRSVVPEADMRKRTNYSCYPRITAAISVAQTFAFLLAAGATAVGGNVLNALGGQAATAVFAGILLGLTVLLIIVLTRWRSIQVVPDNRAGTDELQGAGEQWMPVIVGNPSGVMRRVSILETGVMTRWQEMRRRNRLIR